MSPKAEAAVFFFQLFLSHFQIDPRLFCLIAGSAEPAMGDFVLPRGVSVSSSQPEQLWCGKYCLVVRMRRRGITLSRSATGATAHSLDSPAHSNCL